MIERHPPDIRANSQVDRSRHPSLSICKNSMMNSPDMPGSEKQNQPKDKNRIRPACPAPAQLNTVYAKMRWEQLAKQTAANARKFRKQEVESKHKKLHQNQREIHPPYLVSLVTRSSSVFIITTPPLIFEIIRSAADNYVLRNQLDRPI